MNKENCTKGPIRHHLGRGANPRFHVQTEAGYQIASTPELSRHAQAKEENAMREANAELIAEAFNVLHETGSTPRELEAALADLVATAKKVEGMMDGDRDKQEAWAEELSRLYIALDAAKAALTKHQPATPA